MNWDEFLEKSARLNAILEDTGSLRQISGYRKDDAEEQRQNSGRTDPAVTVKKMKEAGRRFTDEVIRIASGDRTGKLAFNKLPGDFGKTLGQLKKWLSGIDADQIGQMLGADTLQDFQELQGLVDEIVLQFELDAHQNWISQLMDEYLEEQSEEWKNNSIYKDYVEGLASSIPGIREHLAELKERFGLAEQAFDAEPHPEDQKVFFRRMMKNAGRLADCVSRKLPWNEEAMEAYCDLKNDYQTAKGYDWFDPNMLRDIDVLVAAGSRLPISKAVLDRMKQKAQQAEADRTAVPEKPKSDQMIRSYRDAMMELREDLQKTVRFGSKDAEKYQKVMGVLDSIHETGTLKEKQLREALDQLQDLTAEYRDPDGKEPEAKYTAKIARTAIMGKLNELAEDFGKGLEDPKAAYLDRAKTKMAEYIRSRPDTELPSDTKERLGGELLDRMIRRSSILVLDQLCSRDGSRERFLQDVRKEEKRIEKQRQTEKKIAKKAEKKVGKKAEKEVKHMDDPMLMK